MDFCVIFQKRRRKFRFSTHFVSKTDNNNSKNWNEHMRGIKNQEIFAYGVFNEVFMLHGHQLTWFHLINYLKKKLLFHKNIQMYYFMVKFACMVRIVITAIV